MKSVEVTYLLKINIQISMIRPRERRRFHWVEISWSDSLTRWESTLKYPWLDLEKEEDFIELKSVEETYFLNESHHWNINDQS